MNTYKFFIPLLVMLSISPLTFASEKTIELKKGCLKDYPLVSGENDPDLLNIYHQICDKKNKKNIELKKELSIQAAQRFQALGQNLKALQLVDDLRKQNIQRRELTDIAFLAGVSLAESNLQYMRNNEMRYLSAEITYPSAKKLSDQIQNALPEPDTSTTQAATVNKTRKQRIKKPLNSSTLSNRAANKTTSLSHGKNVNLPSKITKTSARNTTADRKSQTNNSITSASSPFVSFNKN